MLDKLKRLGAETAVYGVSTILSRFLNFLLVFFYTNVFPPGEYGIVANVFSWVAFVNVLYGYGMESAFFKYVSTREIGTAKQIFSTPLLSLLGTSLVLSLAVSAAAGPIGGWIDLPASHTAIVSYTAWILFFDTVAIIPFALLRMEGKAVLFGATKLANIVINVAANVLLVLVWHRGIEGVFIAGLIASLATLLLLLPTIVRNFEWSFFAPLYRALLKFGLPYVPAGLAAMMIQVVDRPILLALTNYATVGVYQANYRLGIFMMLLVSVFDYAWRPFFLNNANDPDAKGLFARVLTYYLLVLSVVFLVLSFFIEDLVRLRIMGRHLIGPDYWGGLPIVPVVLLAYVFLGVFNNLIAGVYIEKKTHHLPFITVAGALVNVGANLGLIPLWGIMGAALATLLSYLLMAAILYVDVQRFYPVHYEWSRIARLAVAAALVFALHSYVSVPGFTIGWKLVLLFLFAGILRVTGFFRPGELPALARLFRPSPRTASSTDIPTI